MTITKAQAKRLGEEALTALQEVAKRNGLVVEYKGGSFDSNMFRPKFEFKTEQADGEEFARNAWRVGLDPEDFGKEFTGHDGRRFRITGINTRASRFPIETLCIEGPGRGKMFRHTKLTVQRGLGR